MPNKVRTTVRIGGKEYTMAGYDSEEYIHRVAIYVDRKMAQIEENNNNLSTTMLAVLTCVNITDELLKLREEASGFNDEIKSYKQQIEQLKEEKESLSAELDKLYKDYTLLKEKDPKQNKK